MTKLYDGLAEWWPVISPPSEYAEEAALYVEMIRGARFGSRCARAWQWRRQRSVCW